MKEIGGAATPPDRMTFVALKGRRRANVAWIGSLRLTARPCPEGDRRRLDGSLQEVFPRPMTDMTTPEPPPKLSPEEIQRKLNELFGPPKPSAPRPDPVKSPEPELTPEEIQRQLNE